MVPLEFLNYHNFSQFVPSNSYYPPFTPALYFSHPYLFPIAPFSFSPTQLHLDQTQNPPFSPEQTLRTQNPPALNGKKAVVFPKKTMVTEEEVYQYKAKVQNNQRNVMSNIAHHLMSYLRKSTKIRPILQKIIERNNLSISPQDFFDFISKIQLKNYIRVKVLKERWSAQKIGDDLAKAFRMISNYFLNQKYFLWLNCSRKIKGTNKLVHMNKRREFVEILKGTK